MSNCLPFAWHSRFSAADENTHFFRVSTRCSTTTTPYNVWPWPTHRCLALPPFVEFRKTAPNCCVISLKPSYGFNKPVQGQGNFDLFSWPLTDFSSHLGRFFFDFNFESFFERFKLSVNFRKQNLCPESIL